MTPFRLCVAVAVFGMLAVATGRAQGTPVTACRESPCSLIVDWGVGKSVADMPPDRRYGSPAEFEATIREALKKHDLRAVATDVGSTLAIRVKAAYKTRVLCDEMPGTTPDRSCATIGEAIVSFATMDQGAKLPTAVRMINRCGASEGVMSMKQFGKFVGEMIWFALDGEQLKANKPSGKC